MEHPTSHAQRVARLVEQFQAIPPDAPVRLAKKTSNLFRQRAATTAPGLDVTSFTHVLHVDPVARTASVEGMVTYEQLVDATLPYGLMPLVVPQLKTITLGGAVTGLGIESSSFRNGCPHESVSEMEILTGDGRVIVARADNEHADLFHAFPNSYGTLGYALRLEIELEPVKAFVALRHLRFREPGPLFAEMARLCTERTLDGRPVDFVDGTVFSRDELYLTVGTFVDEATHLSDYTWTEIYYRSLQSKAEDFLTTRDYLWRWDTDWFWCSRAFGAQKKWVRRLAGRRFLRSDVYWKIVAFERRTHLNARIEKLRGLAPREDVVQDIEVPIGRAEEFCEFFLRDIPIEPFWICPLRQRDPDAEWPLYRFTDSLYVNFGFWSTVPLAPGQADGDHNQLIERVVDGLGGRKSLYSTSFYSEDEFWRLYNGPAYEVVKKTYDPEARLLDLYAKCVRNR
ncbi:FAD-binding oxidoreductase [Sporichthya sp.]|uniref:FAD-binding oxidoreductase n=1 Tax=Sporichthya sp. TaxID=65475 RepID=UPI0018292EC4|nr:FAD-binding oxidoreductase [Sporichthya sp.]MBA3742145.1 FAD-binding oxidoreductase [Sporichthya sp.]